jgi:hypothetical protein
MLAMVYREEHMFEYNLWPDPIGRASAVGIFCRICSQASPQCSISMVRRRREMRS